MPSTTTFLAPDIHCEGCATSIRKALSRTAGISGIEVDVAAKTVKATHEGPAETVTAALERIGFPATVQKELAHSGVR